jgi:ubiquinone/menaquinone biosynthesis C-methylase UbiE
MNLENDKIFSRADLYDLAFSWDLSHELSFIESLMGRSQGRRVLVAACGTGRYALPLAKLGCKVTAFDLHTKMLQFAVSYRSHENISYRLDDLTQMSELKSHSQDFGILLNNSFRYILDEMKAMSHLRQVSRVLKTGASYLMELGLNDTKSLLGGSYEWISRRGDELLKSSWTLKRLQVPYSLDLVCMDYTSPFGNEKIYEEQRQRIWTLSQLREAIKDTALEIVQCYNYSSREEVPMAEAATRSGKYYLLLKKKVMT